MANTSFQIDLKPITLEKADKEQKPLLEKALKNVGMIPNMYENMVNSPGLMDTYTTGYQHLRNNSGFTPVEMEVIFLAVSVENKCEYCIAAHSFIADNFSKVPKEVTDAIRDGKIVPDTKLNALSEFSKVMLATRGNPSQDEVDAFTAAGYSHAHILEIILALAVKTISNYANHIFHTEIDEVFSSRKLQMQ